MLYTSSWSRFELTTSVVIYTDCIGSCKSNYPYNHGHSGPLLQCYFYMNPRTSYYLCTSFICNLCLVYYLHVLCRFIVYAIFVYNIVLFSGKTIVSFMDDQRSLENQVVITATTDTDFQIHSVYLVLFDISSNFILRWRNQSTDKTFECYFQL